MKSIVRRRHVHLFHLSTSYDFVLFQEAVYVETRTPQEQMMLSSLKCKIPSKSLTLGIAVHSGAHTTVCIAKMRRPNGLQEEVAVKLEKEGAPPEYTLRLLEEAAILQELQHHHILHLKL